MYRNRLLNVVVPLVIGAMLYYIFLPETLFVTGVDEVMGFSFHIPIATDNRIISLARNYLFDALWAYSLMSLIIYIFGYNRKIYVSILLFEIVMELIQLFPFIKGTFDVYDILVELLISILVIKISERRLQDEEN